MTANIPEHSGFTKIPYGKLGIIAMKGTEEIAAKIDKYDPRLQHRGPPTSAIRESDEEVILCDNANGSTVNGVE